MTGIRHERAKRRRRLGDEQTSARNVDAAPTQTNPPGAEAPSPQKPKAGPRRKILLGAAGLLILAGALWFGIPWVQTTLNTVSTDDAYVNGHVTFVAARVKGQVSRVLVDDNYRVRKGDLLVQLDKEPFQIAVAIKKAAVDTAMADLQVTKSNVRGIEAEAMSRRRALEHAMENVDDQVALLRAKVAGVDKSKAELALAQVDFDRAAKLVVTGDPQVGVRPPAGDLVVGPRGRCRGAGRCPSNPRLFGIAADVRRSRSRPGSAQSRSNLFVCAPGAGSDDSECGSTRRHPFIRRGAPSHGRGVRERRRRQYHLRSAGGERAGRRASRGQGRGRQARSRPGRARSPLLRRRRGDRWRHPPQRQSGRQRAGRPALVAIRSLNEIWVDANFKETQLADLRIGQPVNLYVDMYGGAMCSRVVFPASPWEPDRPWRCCRRRTRPATSSRWFSGCRFASTSRITIRTRIPCSSAPRLFPTSTSTSRPPDPTPGSFCRRMRGVAIGRFDGQPAEREEVTVAALSPARPKVAPSPWLIAAIVVVPAFMEVLDTTIVLVALRYIAGGLSAAADDAEWVITSYLAANAFILPITGWLSAHLGRRNYFLASIAIFTLSSLMCGLAGSLGQLILFRVIQGLAGGGLQPGSQGILLDAFPRERQGVAMTMFGLAVLIAPVVGPTLGGWITDTYNWRWCFLINVPVGIVAIGACCALLRDPDYLVAQRAELKKEPIHFDAIGLSLLAIVIFSWEVMLSKGQEWDWLGDPFWRVQTLVISLVVGLVALIFWECVTRTPWSISAR